MGATSAPALNYRQTIFHRCPLNWRRSKDQSSHRLSASAKGCLSTLADFLRCQVLFTCCQRPSVSERVGHLSVTIAPECIFQGHAHLGAGCHSLIANGV